MRPVARYLLWQAPGWGIAAFMAWAAVSSFDVPVWAVTLAWVVFVLKDIVLYPAMRAVFQAPRSPRYIGAIAKVIEPLAPSGYVRVHGEIWRAEVERGHVPAGTDVVIRDARGLTLVVEPDNARQSPGRP